jgi:hypothetical protein
LWQWLREKLLRVQRTHQAYNDVKYSDYHRFPHETTTKCVVILTSLKRSFICQIATKAATARRRASSTRWTILLHARRSSQCCTAAKHLRHDSTATDWREEDWYALTVWLENKYRLLHSAEPITLGPDANFGLNMPTPGFGHAVQRNK